jgi:hypothetical protein
MSVFIHYPKLNSPHSCPTHSVSLYSQPNYKHHPIAAPLTPSVCIHNPLSNVNLTVVPLSPILCILSPITNPTAELNHPLRHPILNPNHKPTTTAFPRTLSVIMHIPITNFSIETFTQSDALYSQPNHKTSITAVPLPSLFCIHSLITNLNPQLYQSLRYSVYSTQSQTTPYSYLTHSVSLYLRSNHKTHPTAVRLTPSVCIHNPITNLTPQIPSRFFSMYSQPNKKLLPSAVSHT